MIVRVCCSLLLVFFFANAAPTKKEKEEIWLASMRILQDNDTDMDRFSIMPDFLIYRPEKYVKFYLFTNKSDDYEILTLGNVKSVLNSRFDYAKQTKIIVHGWLSSGLNDFSSDMKDAYLKYVDCNVITVDWPAMILYSIARLSVDPVGYHLAKFIDFLVNNAGVEIDSIHVLGHSLGAHIAGIAGKNMKSGKLTWITGLDPAGPLFTNNPQYRIDSSDAEFVDIIHTGGNLIGYYDPIGHVDFYPNGGTPVQPGCGIDIGICTHCRSYEFYKETISDSSTKYLAVPCDNYEDFESSKCCGKVVQLGVRTSKLARGTYYLTTAEKAPFGLGNGSIPPNCLDHADFSLSYSAL